MSTEQEPTTPRPEPVDVPAEVPGQAPQEVTGAAAAGAAPGPDEHAAALEELQDRWRRALADLDNVRKRQARELERERLTERTRTAAAWLPVLDNLELALVHAGSEDASAVLEGVKAVRDQAVEVLRGLGYPRHEETAVPFDPARHEVVGVVDDPAAEPNSVVQVVRPGYGEDGSQLRPASVVVARRQE
ncbi:nucleotide exchange factor GrpE [Streptomyces sp. MI02-7b]|uniref:nucleotide exchange factor GrpE n=1 Tax=Streptomyces sp. MI02-7b TaxID=462941 RepID=UPI0029B65567|nr:nucleotide exchange factor GrpE [Streptomyces sp. MI02-7b]MDX3072512.1 nucleotide exchange factor GrpE [Streptomyces sp. MI02-7b]